MYAQQHTATHCNTLQHTNSESSNTPQHTATHCKGLLYTVTPGTYRVCLKRPMYTNMSAEQMPGAIGSTGWRRLIGSLIFIGIFRKRALNLVALLWKMICNLGDPMSLRHPVREVGGRGRVPFSRNLMSPTPRRKWYLTTGRRFH